MKSKLFIYCTFAILNGTCLCYSALAQKKERLPNIILVLADDLGYGDLKSFNRDAQIPTPNLTQLADRGMIFTNAHSASSVCTPSRYGIITGRYAFRSSLKKGVLGGYSPALIEDNRFTIADMLKAAGYQTAIIGKWHLGLDWNPIDTSQKAIQNKGGRTDLSNVDFTTPVSNGPNDLGFDYSYVLPASLDMSPYLYIENGVSTDYPLVPIEDVNRGRGVFWRGGHASKSFKIEHTLDHFIDQAQQYVHKASKEKSPFFLYLPITAPHTPWLPENTFKGKSGAGTYGDFVAHTDDALGRIFKTLDSLHLTENTLVVFTSDNGADWKKADLKDYPRHSANYIFRGEKSDIWEGGHHIPLIMTWPAVIKAGSQSQAIVCQTDFMATIAGIVNQQLPAAAAPDSFNFWPLISGKSKAERPSIIHHSINGMFAIRQGKWKFIDGKGSGGWTAADPNDSAAGQLFDMEADEGETNNLYNQHPEVVVQLKQLLERQKQQGFSIQ